MNELDLLRAQRAVLIGTLELLVDAPMCARKGHCQASDCAHRVARMTLEAIRATPDPKGEGWTTTSDPGATSAIERSGRPTTTTTASDHGASTSGSAASAPASAPRLSTSAGPDPSPEITISSSDPRQRGSSDEALRVLADLVRLKDGPRDSAYYAERGAVWDRARALVASGDVDCAWCNGRDGVCWHFTPASPSEQP